MVKVQRLFAKTNLKIPVCWRGHVFFSPPHTHLKIDAHHKAIRPLRRPEGWPPYTLPGGQLPTDGTSGTPSPTAAQNKMRETADEKQSPAFIGLEFLRFLLCKEGTPHSLNTRCRPRRRSTA